MKPTNLDETPFDDLKIIKGIGEATEHWLNESLGITNYEQLAACPKRKIETELKALGRTTGLNHIDEWITQAQILAINARRHVKAASAEAPVRKSTPSGKDANWEPYATFVVEFMSRKAADGSAEQRTLCQQNETAKEKVWSGINVEQLGQWMMTQVDTNQSGNFEAQTDHEPTTLADSSPETAATEPLDYAKSAATSNITVRIAEVRVFQPLESHTPCAVATAGGNFTGTVLRDLPAMFEVSLRLDGAGVSELTEEPPLISTEILAYNRSTATSEHLVADSADRLSMEDELSYCLKLPESMLKPGVYRLDCLASVAGVPMSTGYLKIPCLQVA